jgi:tetratricopeptide (TPR) repeat protein
MSEAHRSGTHDAASDRHGDRDAKIEQLLLVGLDHYFAARYELAINVWTRALFFDRNHARARAYIERARSALAERQRQSEELLQTGVAAFQRGDGDEARRLLQAAIDGGAPSDEAHAVLDRLNRLETTVPAPAAPPKAGRAARIRVPRPPDGARGPARTAAVMFVLVALAASGAFAIRAFEPSVWTSIVGLTRTAGDVAMPRAPISAGPVAPDASLPLPLRGDTTLTRARALVASGHLHDALTALDTIRPTDAQKSEADRVRGDIQRQLLAATPLPTVSPERDKGERRVP